MTKEQLLKRLRSFGWRFMCVALIAGISWATENLGMFEVPVVLQGIIGLALGEVTKWLRTNTDMFGARLK
jgi:hypothetical protein